MAGRGAAVGRTFQARMTGLALLAAGRADRPGVQPGQPPVRRLQPQPACGEHPQHVPERDQRDVTVAQQRPGAAGQPVRPDADLLHRLARMPAAPGITPSRHSYPGRCWRIC
jgi:hypothetical protein